MHTLLMQTKKSSSLISHSNIRQHIEPRLQSCNPQQISFRRSLCDVFGSICDIYTFKMSSKSGVDVSARLFLMMCQS